MADLTIGDIARRTKVRPSTLRYYEQIGLLPAPTRVRGQRRYEETIVPQIAMVKLAQRAGFTIAEIKILLHGFPADTPPSTRWHSLAREKVGEIDGLLLRIREMKQLLEAGLLCNCVRLSECSLCEGT